MTLQLREFQADELGEFIMGENAGDKFANDTERPAHQVRLERPFALGKFLVTVGAYRLFAPDHAPNEDVEWPVVNVSWIAAQSYCEWLSERSGLACRLPSEAEWEFACRAGSQTPFAIGNELTAQDANFLFSEYGERIGAGHRTRVGAFPANAFGLHDLHGNVCEWVADAWHPNYRGAPANGSAWTADGDETRRAIRGGAWDYLPRLLRSAWRDSFPADQRRDNIGFRIACDL
ncbi:MAG: formylglycine-generating enzyme family protein [Chthoniobacterales bacterium]